MASQKGCAWKRKDLTLPEVRDGIPGKGDRVHQGLQKTTVHLSEIPLAWQTRETLSQSNGFSWETGLQGLDLQLSDLKSPALGRQKQSSWSP